MLNTKTYIGWLLATLSGPCAATVYELSDPVQSVLGADQSIQTVYEDTLYDLARRYSLGSEELIRVNPQFDPWLPGADKDRVDSGPPHSCPPVREGIVVNIAEHRLYYYPKPKRHQPQQVISYPVSIGKMDWRTPLGETRVIAKQMNPWWIPTESVRAEHAQDGTSCRARAPGPDNPLGDVPALAVGRALSDSRHQQPDCGRLAVTHGCIRMYPEDIEALFQQVEVYEGAHRQRACQGRLGRWRTAARSASAGGAEGQSYEPDIDKFSDLLREAVGDTTVAITTGITRATSWRAPMVCWQRLAWRRLARVASPHRRRAGETRWKRPPIPRHARGGGQRHPALNLFTAAHRSR